MTRSLLALCILLADVLVHAAFVRPSHFHDYVKDGRPVDGPFPTNLQNAPYFCYQAPLKGPCARMFVVYFYDVVRRACMPMLYSGCGGNENRFTSKAACETYCERKRRI